MIDHTPLFSRGTPLPASIQQAQTLPQLQGALANFPALSMQLSSPSLLGAAANPFLPGTTIPNLSLRTAPSVQSGMFLNAPQYSTSSISSLFPLQSTSVNPVGGINSFSSSVASLSDQLGGPFSASTTDQLRSRFPTSSATSRLVAQHDISDFLRRSVQQQREPSSSSSQEQLDASLNQASAAALMNDEKFKNLYDSISNQPKPPPR